MAQPPKTSQRQGAPQDIAAYTVSTPSMAMEVEAVTSPMPQEVRDHNDLAAKSGMGIPDWHVSVFDIHQLEYYWTWRSEGK